jgi:glycerol-3-phosphate dehydrogenase
MSDEVPGEVDLLVVGGGINGAGIARDAAGRGLKVLLVERDDLSSHTSSWSTKLVHGGLRYLEHYEFRLVRESLKEREVLLRAAPHLVRPLRFVLPHHAGLRPAWLLRLGLFLYDNIGGRKLLAPTRTVDLRNGPLGEPLESRFVRGFEYTDCEVDDSRLVVVNAMDARARGATILTRTALTGGRREDGAWTCRLRGEDGQERTVKARAVANAAGPWVTDLLAGLEGTTARKKIRLVKGSHVVTRRLFDHDRAYIFQNADGRIVFAIPYMHGGTLIGTTDVPYEGDPAKAEASEEEVAYLCASVSEYLERDVGPADVTSTYSGVRPLYDDLSAEDAQAVTRDYAFDVDRGADGQGAPCLSVFGGKLTTYRKLAEHAMRSLARDLPGGGPWTRDAPLPGGAVGYEGLEAFGREMRGRYAFLPEGEVSRLLRRHGNRLPRVLGDASDANGLGEAFGHGLYEAEVDYLMREEWATRAEDVLERRTRLGLAFGAAERERLAARMGG